MKKVAILGVGLALFGMASVSLVDSNTSSSSIKTEKSSDPSPDAIEAAKKAIKAEPKVRDFIYQPGQAVEWQIGVLDNGTSRVGYANYICEVLTEHGALKPRTHVRIVDIVKVTNGKNFRSASLGHVACADRRVITP